MPDDKPQRPKFPNLPPEEVLTPEQIVEKGRRFQRRVEEGALQSYMERQEQLKSEEALRRTKPATPFVN